MTLRGAPLAVHENEEGGHPCHLSALRASSLAELPYIGKSALELIILYSNVEQPPAIPQTPEPNTAHQCTPDGGPRPKHLL